MTVEAKLAEETNAIRLFEIIVGEGENEEEKLEKTVALLENYGETHSKEEIEKLTREMQNRDPDLTGKAKFWVMKRADQRENDKRRSEASARIASLMARDASERAQKIRVPVAPKPVPRSADLVQKEPNLEMRIELRRIEKNTPGTPAEKFEDTSAKVALTKQPRIDTRRMNKMLHAVEEMGADAKDVAFDMHHEPVLGAMLLSTRTDRSDAKEFLSNIIVRLATDGMKVCAPPVFNGQSIRVIFEAPQDGQAQKIISGPEGPSEITAEAISAILGIKRINSLSIPNVKVNIKGDEIEGSATIKHHLVRPLLEMRALREVFGKLERRGLKVRGLKSWKDAFEVSFGGSYEEFISIPKERHREERLAALYELNKEEWFTSFFLDALKDNYTYYFSKAMRAVADSLLFEVSNTSPQLQDGVVEGTALFRLASYLSFSTLDRLKRQMQAYGVEMVSVRRMSDSYLLRLRSDLKTLGASFLGQGGKEMPKVHKRWSERREESRKEKETALENARKKILEKAKEAARLGSLPEPTVDVSRPTTYGSSSLIAGVITMELGAPSEWDSYPWVDVSSLETMRNHLVENEIIPSQIKMADRNLLQVFFQVQFDFLNKHMEQKNDEEQA